MLACFCVSSIIYPYVIEPIKFFSMMKKYIFEKSSADYALIILSSKTVYILNWLIFEV